MSPCPPKDTVPAQTALRLSRLLRNPDIQYCSPKGEPTGYDEGSINN